VPLRTTNAMPMINEQLDMGAHCKPVNGTSKDNRICTPQPRLDYLHMIKHAHPCILADITSITGMDSHIVQVITLDHGS